MKKSVRPPEETRRQEMLESYNILDTQAETAFDDLCVLAAELCAAPMGTITLIDRERQWFKARVGMAASEGPRDTSFCGHAVNGHELVYVPDLAVDERFADNPLVTGATKFRFYAGAPLIVPTGEVLGTICVIDTEPRELTPAQQNGLVRLARTVVAQLELRSHVNRMAERERLVNQNLQAQRRDQRARADFFTRMCHELRTPVIGILGMLQAVQGPELNDQQISQVLMARQAGDGLLGLVNNILDLSALENQRMTVERSDFDLTSLIDRTMTLFTSAARAKEVALMFTIGGDLEHWVSSDPTRLQQILTNLVGNAVKFTAKGEVEISVVREAGDAIFTVRDTGPGIPAEAIDKIFQPYVQADDSIVRKYGGTGLGLPISKEIAELLGGRIECRSTVGQGSEFIVRLPLPLAARPDATPVHGLRVLVVDDVTINQKVLKAMLTPHKAEVHMASSGEQALEMYANARYDLILMDRYMPGMDGIEATRLIRQLEAVSGVHTPILGTSAAIEASERQHFLNAGADDTVAKPMRMDEFWPKVNRIRALSKGRAA